MSKKRKKQKKANSFLGESRNKKNIKPVIRIKVVGIGGGGGNAVSRMSKDFVRGVDFVAINTDAQDLECCGVKYKINIGRNLTKGMGTGMNPELGRQAAEENRSDLTEAFQGADLVFLTAGMGGGTGTGAIPVIAEIVKESGALAVAVVTKPFAFEGSQRARIAEEGILKLKEKVDSLIIIPNDRIFGIIGNDTPIMKAFMKIDDILKNTVQGISEIISSAGLVNVDFADVRTIMENMGLALVGVGQASGHDRAMKAANQAVSSPLLEFSIDGAKAVLFGVSGGRDLKMAEINEAAKLITENVDPSAKIIFGAYFDRKLKAGQLKITLIATGFNGLARENTFGLFSSLKSDSAFKKPEKEESGTAPARKEEMSKDKEAEAMRARKKEEDILEIPTFLRRKRR
jgi:cell division protein FtsZ